LKKSARRAKHIDRLKADLSALRGMLQETQEHYQVRTGGLLAQMLLVVDPPEGAARPVLPSRKAVDQMLEAVRTLKVKPKKGRGKDLQRIQDLLEALWVMFPPQP
jgi:DNA primase